MYAVCVTFRIAPGRMHEFLPLMREQARASLERESGCHQFDICADPADGEAVFLYEIYENEAAFRLHLDSAHFKTFDAAVAGMVTEKEVRTWYRLD
ncbi:putative quinol monooxygenase [Jhaorihella thermophila]|uniref:Quinol monooxygenase YgiN n=1 Tax=Jhaorihella thermophila TaxID=488547 RepID=A0A1H5RQZ9_9RHOB|nr:putative quinol monooxygenase [Jhaorihella thermophila]SEF40725.1 Quinol monooxygenase YgiN [Jhaorihella thermophila]